MAICIKGRLVDEFSRCEHWHSKLDVIALKFKCCDEYYGCISCHEELAVHELKRYNIDLMPDVKVILCGVCKYEMTFQEYISTENYSCLNCQALFNPDCKLHYHLYFESEKFNNSCS